MKQVFVSQYLFEVEMRKEWLVAGKTTGLTRSPLQEGYYAEYRQRTISVVLNSIAFRRV